MAIEKLRHGLHNYTKPWTWAVQVSTDNRTSAFLIYSKWNVNQYLINKEILYFSLHASYLNWKNNKCNVFVNIWFIYITCFRAHSILIKMSINWSSFFCYMLILFIRQLNNSHNWIREDYFEISFWHYHDKWLIYLSWAYSFSKLKSR